MIVINSDTVEAVQAQDEIVGKGPVYMKPLIDAKQTGGFGVLLVTFSPGARLHFHTHTYEQILYVTEGKGIVATKDAEHTVTAGAAIYIPPGEVHWHGATEDASFSHIAIQKPGIALAR
jgi:quercetin dioxygenase-like cupin family protein